MSICDWSSMSIGNWLGNFGNNWSGFNDSWGRSVDNSVESVDGVSGVSARREKLAKEMIRLMFEGL